MAKVAAAVTLTAAPTSAAVQGQLNPQYVRRGAFQRRLNEIFHLTNSAHIAEGAEHATAADRWRARAEESQVRADLALVSAEIEDLERELRAAQDRERDAKHAECHARKKPVIARLSKALDAAARINAELLAIENEEQTAVRVTWHELFNETPLSASRLVNWQRFVKSEFGIDV
jgi:hypothetical protein